MKKKTVDSKETRYVTLKIALVGTDISRTIVVPEATKLYDLHFALQGLFGWMGGHLWDFEISRLERYGIPEDWRGGWDDDEIRDCEEVTIGEVLPSRGSKMIYLYDMGDSWKHTITRMADPKVPGTRVCKTSGLMGIDDIGGSWALCSFVEQLKKYDANPKAKLDEEFEDILEWSGFDDEDARKKYLTEPDLGDLTATLKPELEG